MKTNKQLVLDKLSSLNIDYVLTELTDGTVISFFGNIEEEEIEMLEALCGEYSFGISAFDLYDTVNKRQLNTIYISNEKINEHEYLCKKGSMSMLSFKDNEFDFLNLHPIYLNHLIRIINKCY